MNNTDYKYLALVSDTSTATEQQRLSRHARVIRLPRDKALRDEVSSHPDMILTVFRSEIYLRESYYRENAALIDNICALAALTAVPVYCDVSAYPLDYPLDAAFNALVLPDRDMLIGRKKSLAEPLSALAAADTNQGYAGCTALYLGGCVVSADKSMLKAAESLGVPTYPLPEGGIMLPGYNTGFVGGSGGVLYGENGGSDTLFVYGSVCDTPVASALSELCTALGVVLVSLGEGELFDRGGIKFLPLNALESEKTTS